MGLDALLPSVLCHRANFEERMESESPVAGSPHSTALRLCGGLSREECINSPLN